MLPQTQHTGPLSDLYILAVVEWVIETAVGYLFYSVNIVISFTVIYLLTTTSTRMTRGQLGLLFSTIFMLLVSTLFVSLNTAIMLAQIQLVAINPLVIISLKTSINIVAIYVDRLNFITCDGIAVWRAWILYPRNLVAKIVLILCMIGSVGTPASNHEFDFYFNDCLQDLNRAFFSVPFGCTVIIVLEGTSPQFSQMTQGALATATPTLSATYPLLVVLIVAHERSKEASNVDMSLTQSIKFASKNSTEPEIQG
ncbi:hypothetical protein K435DRAFT_800824 [Dendrothele bispora CBS 962.96]|uniref:Uncharacterized protein n=1 Tax=Dendrothele bispora (strain CBS 962.96) TaxID=1314807 RepID=A0A4V4HET1_DENBC|nr:hypothetical protein K435DRAFT_800824 [Dendrothele bispora CBS 962.96]